MNEDYEPPAKKKRDGKKGSKILLVINEDQYLAYEDEYQYSDDEKDDQHSDDEVEGEYEGKFI